MPNHLLYLPAGEADYMAEDAVPILGNLPQEELDEWIPRLIRAKRPFALDSAELIPPESLVRLSETAARRKLAIAILHSYRLLPVFARLKELIASNCLGTPRTTQLTIPSTASPILCTDLAEWLCPSHADLTFTVADDSCITLQISADNGYASARFNVMSHISDFTTNICGTTRVIAVPYADPFRAEMDILVNTLPYRSKWPLLMHVDDAATAIERLSRFPQVTQKIARFT